MCDDLNIDDNARIGTCAVGNVLGLLGEGNTVDGGRDAGAGTSCADRWRVRLLLEVVERVEVADRELVGEGGDGAPVDAALDEARNGDTKLRALGPVGAV